MFEWYHIVVASLVGAAGLDLARYIRERVARPYRFKCSEEGCFFRAASDEKDIMRKVVTDHAIRFHATDDQS